MTVTSPPEASAASGKQFACVCMDVTAKELKTAVAEGFDSMELLKRYTTITMGPCQGKACMASSQRLCGAVTGRSFAETSPTTSRPPWVPVEMGTLAGARLVELLKQPQFSPLPFEEQTVSIFAGTNGYLDTVPVDKVTDYEARMLSFMRSEHAGVLEEIRTSQKFEGETADKTKAALEAFGKQYA